MSRKTVIGLLILVILVGLALGALFFFFTQSEESEGPRLRDFFPFGSDNRSTSETPSELEEDALENASQDVVDGGSVATLRKLYDHPVSGITVFTRGEDTVIRFVERETGHIFETQVGSSVVERVTNTTIPRVQQALWLGSDTVLVQYLDDADETLETFFGTIVESASTSTEATLTGSFLPTDITSVAVAPSTPEAFFILGSAGSDALIVSESAQLSSITSLPFSELLTQWPGGRTIAFTTKPSAFSFGFTYFLNLNTGAYERVLENIGGLTTLVSPDRSLILYSEGGVGNLALSIANTQTNTQTELPVTTLPEKCVWSIESSRIVFCGVPNNLPQIAYPDSWYQGLISFSDTLWEIDTEANEAHVVLQPADLGHNLDMTYLKLSPSEQHLVFIDKNELIPWLVTFPTEILE